MLVELSLRSVEPGWPAQHECGDPIRIADGQVQRGPSAERDAADDEPSKLKLVGEGDHVVGEGVECGRGRVDVAARRMAARVQTNHWAGRCISDIAERLVRVAAQSVLEHEGHGSAARGVDRLVDQAGAADLKSARR